VSKPFHSFALCRELTLAFELCHLGGCQWKKSRKIKIIPENQNNSRKSK